MSRALVAHTLYYSRYKEMRSKSVSQFQVADDRQHKQHFLKHVSQGSLDFKHAVDIDGGSSLGDPSYISNHTASSNFFSNTYGPSVSKMRRRKRQRHLSATKRAKSKQKKRASSNVSHHETLTDEVFVDPTVLERAKQWFSTKDDEDLTVKPTVHFMGEHFNTSHINIEQAFTYTEVEGAENEEKKDTKAKTKDMFGFRRKKYVKGLSIKKKVEPQLQVDFLQGASSNVHAECMKSVAVREYYVKMLSETLKNSRVIGIMYKGGPRYLFEHYLKIFKDICLSTIDCVEKIDEWRYDLESNVRIKYNAKHNIKLRRPAFLWRERIERGERVLYRTVNYMDKMISDLNSLLSQAVLPSKLGMKRQLIVDAARISSDYLKGVSTSPFLIKDTLKDVAEKNAMPLLNDDPVWGFNTNNELDESKHRSETTLTSEDRVYESETWYGVPPEKIRKVAKILLEHERYYTSKNYVSKDNAGAVNQLSAVIERKDKRLQPSIISNAADTLLTDKYMRGTAKKERKYYERIAKKTERDQFINSLSIGLEKSLISPHA